MQFEGSGNIYTYNYMYSNAYAALEEIGLTTYGKGIAIVTFSAFMLESYFNHVCQVIFDVPQRVNEALDSFINKDFLKMKELELPNLPFNEKVDLIFKIRDSLAHGRTHKVSGKANLKSILTCDWQETCFPERSKEIFEQATEIVNSVDERIESQIILGVLQDQFGAVRGWEPNKSINTG